MAALSLEKVDHSLNATELENSTEYAMVEYASIHWWIGLLELFVFVFGVPLNLTVFYLVYRSRKRTHLPYVRNKRRVTEMFVISMTAADLLFCSIHAPMMFLSFNREINLSSIPCLTMFAVTHTSTVASSLSLLWLNFNKFFHLHRPLHHFLFITRARAMGLIGIGWMASIGWGLLLILGPFIRYDSQCNIYLHHKSIYVIFAGVFFVLPTFFSLVISLYVASVVVETNTGNSQKYIAHYQNRRFYGGGHKSSTTTRVDDEDHYEHEERIRVHFANENNNEEARRKKSSLDPVLSHSRIFQRRRAFSPTSWPPPSHFRAISPSARRIAHIRRISFVFTTTIWTSLTALPYRLAYILKSLPKPEPDDPIGMVTQAEINEQDSSFDLAVTIYFCLFAIMTLNAAGNPLITILTQHQYSTCLNETWTRMIRGKPSNRGCYMPEDGPYRHSLARSSGDSAYDQSKKDALVVDDGRRNSSFVRTSFTSQSSR